MHSGIPTFSFATIYGRQQPLTALLTVNVFVGYIHLLILIFTFALIFLNAGMPDCLISGQPGTGMKNRPAMSKPARYRNKRTHSGTGLRCRCRNADAGMPMPECRCRNADAGMPMPAAMAQCLIIKWTCTIGLFHLSFPFWYFFGHSEPTVS